ncbi:alkene reductase [Paraburkholderia ginsengiterrae]|uniref:Alkene reductase n=1 Tax=Paraburkholderia ginsengiterrae TaxID=1462993 RepID=A0A1A9N7C6_9BURK|nr:alkene reductase [Paraburkholderia ginsengiterrae]OAJ55015.1 alkene reductase [Paraburkholderia ginsengiterrae]OAJ61197.1 alkene reductase [Paraburkholderia ginsengiterrae]
MKLFSQTNVGTLNLKHRVVLAPLTRMRTEPGNVPGDAMVEYYAQRASEGGLLITDATAVAPLGIAYVDAPGMWTRDQVAGWKRVVQAVHAKGGHLFVQLWHAGRQAHPANTGGLTPVAPSALRSLEHAAIRDEHGDIAETELVVPRELETDEIAGIVEQFRQSAILAKEAGFDGIELHGANGYLFEQFLLDGSNHRTDAYGGPIENRAKFLFDTLDAVVGVWGPHRVAVRLSPSGTYGTMSDSDPHATFGYVAARLNGYDLAYLHVIEPRISGIVERESNESEVSSKDIRRVFKGPLVAAGGFTRDSAEQIVIDGHADLVAFGRMFIANPDLPDRLRHGLPLNRYDRSTFYGGDTRGYTDYPFASSHASGFQQEAHA